MRVDMFTTDVSIFIYPKEHSVPVEYEIMT